MAFDVVKRLSLPAISVGQKILGKSPEVLKRRKSDADLIEIDGEDSPYGVTCDVSEEMSAMRRPKTVKVTVYSSRNLRPKKGDGDPLAWVVFGFGKEKCCTQQIRDRNPKWNEESTFTITDPKLPLKLNVKDKDDMLGQIVIPMNDLPSDEHFLKWVPLGQHKRNSNPTGELCLDCWIDDFYDNNEPSDLLNTPHSPNPIKYFNKTLSRLTGRSPEPERKNYGNGTSMKGSLSVDDLCLNKRSPNSGKKAPREVSLVPPVSYSQGNGHTNLRKAASSLTISETKRPLSEVLSTQVGLATIKEQCYPPKVLDITPRSGPTSGGTLIQITGKYLGVSKEDITRLMVAGCNCLPTLQYYTPNKILCTTGESVGIGPISMSTKSGGLSSSKLMFEFVHGKADEPVVNGVSDSGRSSGLSEADHEKDELIEKLRGEVEGLRSNNRELREYIDKLVAYLMDKYPDALESSKMYK